MAGIPRILKPDGTFIDINQAGLGRGLLFELFRPGQVQVKDYYAELPIAIRVSGRYHDIGSFTADVANLSRIVTLHNLNIIPAKDGVLAMDATARRDSYGQALTLIAERAYAVPLYSLPVYYVANADLVFTAHTDEIPHFWAMYYR